MAQRDRERHGGRRGGGSLERGSSASTAHGGTSALVHVNVSQVREHAPSHPHPSEPSNPPPRLRCFLCKWQLKAPRHGGRGGGRIKAQAARLPSYSGCDGRRRREALSRAMGRSRARSRSRVAVEAVTAARSCSRRSVGSLGGGCGHGVPLHSCPPWAARAARTSFRHSERLPARAHASPHELREQLSGPK